MLDLLSTAPPRFAPQLPDPRKIGPLLTGFAANSAGSAMSSTGMAALKFFAMLVGQGEGAPPAKKERIVSTHSLAPEPRYAYYRRCQQFRRNGEQCKAPAMKGEHICHRHAEQADMERRRAQQRRDFLSRPSAGLGSFRAIQRTIGELAGAILAGSIDHKAAGRLIVDIQTAIRLQKMLTATSVIGKTRQSVIGKRTGKGKETITTEARRRGGIHGRAMKTGIIDTREVEPEQMAFAAVHGRFSTREQAA
jgi:hypothetical protein